jgi:hypothetical protein
MTFFNKIQKSIDLFSAVAGLFGLFTGASILTFVELAELGLDMFFLTMNRQRRKAELAASTKKVFVKR